MQEITISSRGHLKLAALSGIPDRARCLVISCHGFRGCKENGGRIFNFSKRLNQIGIGLLAFDFQGSGQSEGLHRSLSLTRQARDLQDVVSYADRNFHLPLVLLGRSFGGSTVLAGASRDARIAGYVFWSTPVFLTEVFMGLDQSLAGRLNLSKTITLHDESGSYELDPDLILDFANHDMDDYIRAIGKKPVLIIHGQSDEVVAPENARYMARMLPNSRLYLMEGADHRFTQHTFQREDLTINWLADHGPVGSPS